MKKFVSNKGRHFSYNGFLLNETGGIRLTKAAREMFEGKFGVLDDGWCCFELFHEGKVIYFKIARYDLSETHKFNTINNRGSITTKINSVMPHGKYEFAKEDEDGIYYKLS
jgi:hypothetical protein